MAAKRKQVYRCKECQIEHSRWYGRCPECGAWNALEEVIAQEAPTTIAGVKLKPTLTVTKALPIGKVDLEDSQRMPSGFGELDRVLGGGWVPGSLVLLGGDPGIGKSTLLLQAAQSLAAQGKKVLYASGEESARQIRLRASRLQAEHPNLFVLAETDISLIEAETLALKPDWLVIDSIQAVSDPEASSLAGSVSQVRAATTVLMRLAKLYGIATCLVGHVTKEGTLAGPRVLEHMVDTVLYFEGERFKSHRLIRSVKNRFGATHEVGIFEMQKEGLVEVSNPSALFLAERSPDASGSAVVPSLEGTRPLLVEIQALVSPTPLAQPRRAANGVDYNRLIQVLAVLEKRVGLGLAKTDVYINVAGGLKIDEPACDLALALAIASSLRDVALPQTLIAIGEIGLNGEVRSVSALEQRLYEAEKLGFKHAIVPAHNWDDSIQFKTLRVLPVMRVIEAIVRIGDSNKQ
jgi:DNA repair protein RadA/Sms